MVGHRAISQQALHIEEEGEAVWGGARTTAAQPHAAAALLPAAAYIFARVHHLDSP